ncbi:SulP family inorganic anion transporter [Nocardioides bizhenqiangii]|uniref:SulP family inorganic anion transporter n=1 Tax=Nocardioides bizhenqiangii TaxID=3095076 RepID=A0ABZ0ZX71_9ACTN|nr:SulP family inorganic anion transporter [Nocardioides sp. HM61]WQQ28262.1 SulP family inorganic anion transporter [Nocardioides sp. HM61]
MSQQTTGRPGWFEAHLPILGWGRRYQTSWLSRDMVAGLTLWGLVVPEGMAYAGIAGLPPEAGLYTAMGGLIAYAVFGSSRQLVVVGTSATAALLAGTVVALKPEDAETYAAYAAALVLLVGVLFVLAGLAKLGFIAQFLSRPVMEGFVLGLAIFVAVGQLNKLFGVEKGEGNVPRKLWHVVTQLDEANWWSFAVGIAALAALFILPRISKALPGGLVVLAGGILLSAVLDLSGNHGVEVVGTLPSGLPSPGIPQVDAGVLWTLVPAAIGILLVSYSEALGVAGSLANKHGYDIDPNQELLALGAANLSSGSLGGLVAGGSMSSSAVNDGAKARSQVSGLSAAIFVVLTILFLTPIFKDLPEAVLAALIIHAVSHLMRVTSLVKVRRLAPAEFWMGILAFAGVLLIDVLEGLVIAMLASLLLVIYRSSRSSVTALGRLPGSEDLYTAMVRNPDAVPLDGVLIIRTDEPVYYANAVSNRDAVRDLVRSTVPPVTTVVFDPQTQHDLDFTTLEILTELLDWLEGRNIEVHLVATHSDLVAIAKRAGLIHLGGRVHVAPTLTDVIAQLKRNPPAETSAADS